MASLENDSAHGYEITIAEVHNVTRIHDPNIYLSTIRFTWSVIYGTRGRRESEKQKGEGREESGREKERKDDREADGPVIISSSKHGRTPDTVVTSNSIGPALVTLRHEHEFTGHINRWRGFGKIARPRNAAAVRQSIRHLIRYVR